MSNDVEIFTKQENNVSTAGRKMTALGTKLAGTITVSSRRIVAKNGTFRKIINGKQVGDAIRGEFNAIIVDMLPEVSRIYYKEKFDPEKEPTLPNCWSNKGDRPEPEASDKQSANCSECPMNVSGSGQNNSKACRYQRRIAILIEGDNSGEVYQFQIPAKSLFGKGNRNVHPFEAYIKFIVANGMSPDNVVTTIAFDDNAETMELLFSPVREINDEEYEQVLAAQAKPEARRYTRITVSQVDGVTKEPDTKKTQPKQVVTRSEEPESEEVEEPVKRPKRKETVLPDKEEDLASIIDEWGAEA